MEDRIKQLIESEDLTASKFAEAIGVQRSSISHIVSGRNKPSLELINKILDRFPTVNTDWLLLGKGSMYTEQLEENSQPKRSLSSGKPFNKKSKRAVKILILYDDHSFEEFIPNS